MNIITSTGKVTMLRVHDLGTGFGPPNDFLDGEVVCRLDQRPNTSFGFQLRQDDLLPSREGMLQLLRDAYRNNWQVSLDAYEEPGKTNHRMFRLWVHK